MNINDAFPSKYLKASDLQGRTVTVTISNIKMEEIGQGQKKDSKLVISFVGKDKELVCNKTNAGTIGKLYGDDTEGWLGQPITLVAREVEFQGDMVMAIRVSLQKPDSRIPAATHRVAPAAPASGDASWENAKPASTGRAPAAAAAGELDEDVPF